MALKKINYNGQSKIILRLCEMVNQLIDGGGGGGSTVTYTQTLSSGTKTGAIEIDGVSTDMYAPTPPTKTSDLNNDSGFIDGTDLSTALNAYTPTADLADVALSNDYDDLSNKPTIPAAQIQSDWNQSDTTAKDYIKNKPTIPTKTSDLTNDSDFVEGSDLASVATSGSYNDLADKPTIPTDFVSKSNGGTFNGNVSVDRRDGTTSSVGYSVITIGNNNPTGVNDNSRGFVEIYGADAYLTRLRSTVTEQNKVIDLPDKAGTVALTSDISSRKFKENINEFSDEEAKKLLDVEMVTFDYKEGITGEDERYGNRGVIAEQVEPIIPYVVEHETIEDEEQIRVDYRKFIPYLIKMVQIQQKEIEELKAIIGGTHETE